MPAKRATSVAADREISQLVAVGVTDAAQIHRHLTEHGFTNEDGSPSAQTVRRRIKRLLPKIDLGHWSVRDADPEDSKRILPVLRWMFDEYSGEWWPSRELAKWIATVSVADDMPPRWVYRFALAYAGAHFREEQDVRCLDLLLATRVWEIDDWDGPDARYDEWEEDCRSLSGEVGESQFDDLMMTRP